MPKDLKRAETEEQKTARETEALFEFANDIAMSTLDEPLNDFPLIVNLGTHLMKAAEDLSRRIGYIYVLQMDIFHARKAEDVEGIPQLEDELKDYMDDCEIYMERVEKLARNLEQTINAKLAALAAASMELATE